MKTLFIKSNQRKKLCFIFSLQFLLSLQTLAHANEYPVSVRDGTNRTVTCKKKPVHIISLGAASTEILFELGAQKQIAAVTTISDYPEEAKKLPTVGDFSASSISIEKMISFKPDLIIIYNVMHDYFIPTFEKYKIPYYVSNATCINDVIDEISDLSVLTGHKERGEELTKKYNSMLDEISKNTTASKNLHSKQNPKVYWEVYNNPYMSVGNSSFMNDVIKIAGGKNIFDQLSQDYPLVSEETIIASNPNYILIQNDTNITKEMVQKRNGWANIQAVKNDKVYIINSDIYTRPGPRIFLAIKELTSILYEN